MIFTQLGEIIEAQTEAIVCNANVLGVMDRSISRLVAQSAGDTVSEEAKDACARGKRLEEGGFFTTSSGKLAKKGINRIYHAVIASDPAGFTSMFFIEKSIKGILKDCVKNKYKSLAIPNLGCNCGFDPIAVATSMSKAIIDFYDKIDIVFVDTDKEFIEKLNTYLLTTKKD